MTDFTFTILAKPNTGDYYEGNRTFLRAIYPRPTVSPVRLVMNPVSNEIVFREDSYDPTTRIRRGRFYQQAEPIQIPSGLVPYQPYPRPQEIIGANGGQVFQFQTVYEQSAKLNTSLPQLENRDALIGAAPAETRWRIIDAEGLSDGTTLFTLKSMFSFGLLPGLKNDDPEINDAYQKLVDAALKYSPVPVVDVCRESTRVILACKIGSKAAHAKDLAKVIDDIPDKEMNAVKNAAFIINRMHSRGKSAEQENQQKKGSSIRSVIDEDAELSVRLFGFILREIGWAE